jgi:DNA (cytosine-5)-methyltransferase 1
MLNGLDLFSGIGGIAIALSEWVRPLAYCEIDPYCQATLLTQMAKGQLHCAPIWDDVKTIAGTPFKEDVDIIYGGFPCQDISIAGNGKGLGGERSGLFFEILRLTKEIEPMFLFLENVPTVTLRGGVQIVNQITELGYDCRWCVISASKWVDQRRERWFLLAKSRGVRWKEGAGEGIQSIRNSSVHEKPCNYKLSNMEKWSAFAHSMRENNGIPRKMDRIRALGNAVVPQQAKEAFQILMGLK